ncbi:MAG TPA: TonB family protein [Flavobacteriales bacterium]|nr:TonB family protein [Flavobacteriales bacterium]
MRSRFPAALLLLSITTPAVVAGNGDPKAAKIYLSQVLEPTTRGKAAFYMVPEGMDGELYVGKIYTMDGKLKAEGRFRDAALTIEEGAFVFYHPNGKVESQGEYVMGNKTGVWLRFDPWGGPLAEKVYNPDVLANILYTRAETMPTFKGGDERAFVRTVKEGVKLPAGTSVKGQVMTSFVVEKNGELSDVKVIEGKDKEIDDQLVDVIKSTSPWTPGVDKGVPVRVQMRVPVQF